METTTPIFFSPLVAFAITIAGILLLKPLAIRLGLVDEPGGRKRHKGNIPLIGGMAMLLGFGFALLTLDVSLSAYRCLIAGSALLVFTGVLDDFHELTPRSRLFIQILVGVLMVYWGNIALQSFGDLLHTGVIQLGFFALPITVVAVLAVINAVNMTDGTDGLAASVGFIEVFYLAWLSHSAHQLIDEKILYLMLAVLLAFLCFNFPWRQKASVFMGDSGSMMLGFVLVWFCIDLSQGPDRAATPVTFLWILAVPLFDISSVVFRRLLRGFSPFKADRGHLHHYLMELGFSPLQVTVSISALSAVLGLVGILGARFLMHEALMLAGFLALFILYLWVLHRAWTRLSV